MRLAAFTLTLAFFMLSGNHSFAFIEDGNGSIKGKVFTSDGKPAGDVTVRLTGTKKSAITKEDGTFILRNIDNGNYTLEISLIGHAPYAQTVLIESNKTTAVVITLNVSSQELEEVIVTGSMYRPTKKESDYVARMPITNLQNPQVYSVVGKELMKEQVVVNILDGLKAAPGATPTFFPSGGIGITMRGFLGEINARNGLQSTLGRASADVSNIERIEFIKGPSGALFGASISSFGGVINLVTKKPFETKAGNVGLTMGSFGLARLTADINTPLDKNNNVLFRVNAAVQRQNNFNEYGFNNTIAFAPSLTYKVSDKLHLLFDAEIFNANSTRPNYTILEPGSGYTNYNQIPLAFRKSLYANDLGAKTQSQKFFVEAKYQMNDNWTSSSNVSFVNEQVDYSYQTYNTWVAPNQVSRWAGIWGPVRNTYANIQQNFTGKIKTGSIKHTVLLGASYVNYTSDGMGKYSPDFDTIDVTQPFTKITRIYADEILLKPGNVNQWGNITNDFIGAYASDVINFGDRLYAMLSLRFDRYIQTQGGLWGEPYKQNALSPKLGLVYQVIPKQVSIFGNYMSGFQNSAPMQQPDGSLLVVKPIYANQWEAGIKSELFNHILSTTLSYYHIAIDNAIRTDNDLFARQDGEQVSKGVEFELLATPLQGLNIMAGYGYNENTIVKASVNEGNDASGTPRHMFNTWVSYRVANGVLKNFGIGAGGNAVSKCFFNEDNTITIPAYSVWNASVFYENKKLRIGFKLNNITDKRYWDNWGSYNPTRNFAADIAIKF